MVKSGLKCQRCKQVTMDWCSYFCPVCGQHNDDLYRREHHDSDRAKSMTRSEIVAEYRTSGQPYERRDCEWHSRG